MVVDMVVYIYTWWWTLRTTEEAEEDAKYGQLGAVHKLRHSRRGGGGKLNVDNHTTQCQDEFRNLSRSVLKILVKINCVLDCAGITSHFHKLTTSGDLSPNN